MKKKPITINLLFRLINFFIIVAGDFFFCNAFANSSDQLQPLHMHSQSVHYDFKTNITVYTGDVHAYQGTSYLNGDKVLVMRNQHNEIIKIIDYGRPAHYSTIPDHQNTRLYTHAQKIVYDPIHRIVLLFRDGYAKQNESVMTAPKIRYDIVTGIIQTWPTKNRSQTTIVIQPANTIK